MQFSGERNHARVARDGFCLGDERYDGVEILYAREQVLSARLIAKRPRGARAPVGIGEDGHRLDFSLRFGEAEGDRLARCRRAPAIRGANHDPLR